MPRPQVLDHPRGKILVVELRLAPPHKLHQRLDHFVIVSLFSWLLVDGWLFPRPN